MRPVKFIAVFSLAGFILAGCAGVAHVEKDQNVDLKSYHSYAWVETSSGKNDSVKTKVSDLTERNIHSAVDQELAKAGWKQVKHKPDVLMSYDVLVERSVKDRNTPMYSQPFTRYYYNPYMRRWGSIYYPSDFLGYDHDPVSVRQGTLTISMIDAQTEKTIWQGWTTNEVNSRNLTNKEIQNSIRSIFRKFDVAQR